MSALDELVDLIPPPAAPVGVPFDWRAVEEALGLRLPADYKALCDCYGHGSFFAGWSLDVVAPEKPGGFLALPEHDLDYVFDDTAWLPHPQPGGLLLLASTENSETFWWRTDTWAVLYAAEADELVELRKTTATEAVLLTLQGHPPADWADGGDEAEVDRTASFHQEDRSSFGADDGFEDVEEDSEDDGH